MLDGGLGQGEDDSQRSSESQSSGEGELNPEYQAQGIQHKEEGERKGILTKLVRVVSGVLCY